jgi:rubrerythrin
MYMQLAESTPSKLAVEVLEEIADEERVHVGELLRLLRELAPDEEKLYAEGAKEVEEKIKKKNSECRGAMGIAAPTTAASRRSERAHKGLLSGQNARLRDRIQRAQPWSVRARAPGNSHCTPIRARIQ